MTEACQKSSDLVRKEHPIKFRFILIPKYPKVLPKASQYEIGAVLSHVFLNGEEKPVSYLEFYRKWKETFYVSKKKRIKHPMGNLQISSIFGWKENIVSFRP